VGLATSFEELQAWQAARELTSQIYSAVREEGFSRDFALGDQIRRAAISTMNNVAEGFDSASRNEFRRFLSYAARSASEVQSCLYVALDQGYLGTERFHILYGQSERVRRLCRSLSSYLAKGRKGDIIREPSASYNEQPHAQDHTRTPAHFQIRTPAHPRTRKRAKSHTRTRAHAHTRS
jgi:four helix bundle protein